MDFSPKEHRGRISALTSVIGATQSFNFAMGGGGTIVGAIGNMVGVPSIGTIIRFPSI